MSDHIDLICAPEDAEDEEDEGKLEHVTETTCKNPDASGDNSEDTQCEVVAYGFMSEALLGCELPSSSKLILSCSTLGPITPIISAPQSPAPAPLRSIRCADPPNSPADPPNSPAFVRGIRKADEIMRKADESGSSKTKNKGKSSSKTKTKTKFVQNKALKKVFDISKSASRKERRETRISRECVIAMQTQYDPRRLIQIPTSTMKKEHEIRVDYELAKEKIQESFESAMSGMKEEINTSAVFFKYHTMRQTNRHEKRNVSSCQAGLYRILEEVRVLHDTINVLLDEMRAYTAERKLVHVADDGQYLCYHNKWRKNERTDSEIQEFFVRSMMTLDDYLSRLTKQSTAFRTHISGAEYFEFVGSVDTFNAAFKASEEDNKSRREQYAALMSKVREINTKYMHSTLNDKEFNKLLKRELKSNSVEDLTRQLKDSGVLTARPIAEKKKSKKSTKKIKLPKSKAGKKRKAQEEAAKNTKSLADYWGSGCPERKRMKCS